jgi:nitroreductase
MELLECVNRARATRDFADDPVTEDDVRFLLDTARRAGSGKNRQPWTFVVVRDDERRETLASFGEYASPLEQAPVGIVVLSDIRGSDDDDADFNEFDCGRAVQNLVLAAASRGIGTVPQSIRDLAAAEELLSVPPDKELLVVMAVGHPKRGPDDEIEGIDKEKVLFDTGRRPLDEVVHSERHE